ncbi:MAG: PGF-pre-PGF domain-containing protein [Candidatus Woesearchaeota archaeon]
MNKTLMYLLVFAALVNWVVAGSITIQTPIYDTSVLKDSTFTVTAPIQASELSSDVTATLTPSSGIGLSCPSTSDCQKTVSQSGGSAVFTVRADTTGVKTSPFTISANSGSTSASDVTASTAITVSELPSWSINLAKSASEVSAGDEVTLTLSITISSGTLEDAQVALTKPSGWSITTGSSTYSLGDLSSSTQSVWTLSADSPSATNSFTVAVTGSNSASKSKSTSVTEEDEDTGASPAGGSGGGGFSAYSPDAYSITLVNLPAGLKTLTINKENVSFTSIEVDVKNSITGIVKITLNPIDEGDFPELPSKLEGAVYGYLNLTKTGIAGSDITSIKIFFKVEKSWLESTRVTRDNIRLYRYTDRWNQLQTTFIEEKDGFLHFKADSPGFSYFAVGGIVSAAKEETLLEKLFKDTEIEDQATQHEEQSASVEKPGKFNILPVILIAVICLVIIAVYRLKPKKLNK